MLQVGKIVWSKKDISTTKAERAIKAMEACRDKRKR